MSIRNIIVGFVSVIFLFSCKKSSDDNSNQPQPQPGTGDYAPYSTGSTFTYQSEIAGMSNKEFTLTVSNDTTVDGLVYKKLSSSDQTIFPNRYISYNNNVQREAQFNLTVNGYTIQKLILINLKANEPVNNTWMETTTIPIAGLPISPSANTTHKIMSKDQAQTVLTNNFMNVIHVTSNSIISIPQGIPVPAGTPTNLTGNSYYSKGVGLVERDFLGQLIKLKSYNIKP
jgi:hypothetical protein